MSQWEQWFRGFVKGWFAGVVKGLSKLDDNTRSSLLEEVFKIQSPSAPLSTFNESWKDFQGESEVTKKINESLDAISDLDDETRAFLNKWMETFLESLKASGGTIVTDVLAFSGDMCAKAHAQNLFVELWKEHGKLEPFIHALNGRMSEEHDLFKVIDDNSIEVTYPQCFCPLVNFGLIKIPILCNCSSYWLKSNFETISEKKVKVKKNESVLEGSTHCSFTVQLD